jgi:hypothetical protein
MSSVRSGGGPATPYRPAPFFDHGLFLLHLNRGKEELRKGHYEVARREFEEAKRLRPHDPEVLLNLSITLFHLGGFVEAERMTRELLVAHENAVPLLFNLGLILFKSGREGEAREPLERVLALAPAHRKAHLTLGLICQRAGEGERAQKHFRMAGAELKDGAEEDDSISRMARQAAAMPARPPGSAVPQPPPVKPEPADSMAGAGRPLGVSGSWSRPISGTFRVGRRSDSSPGLALVTPVGPFSPKAGGLLAATTGDGLRVRRGTIVGRTGRPVIESDPRLEGTAGSLLVKASGAGCLLLGDAGRVPFVRTLSRESLSVEPTRLLAFEETLVCREDPAFERRRGTDRPYLKLTGSGAVALSGISEAARFEVEWGQPLTLLQKVVVAWGGELVPELLETPEAGSGFEAGPVIRFVGAGYVLADAR